MGPVDSEYQYIVQREIEHHDFVHGDSPNFSAANVTVFQCDAPDWVLKVPLPEESEPQEYGTINNPHILCDSQFDIASNTFYHHLVYKIWNAYDAEDYSTIEIPFDPAFQKLNLHSCFVERSGRRINKLDMKELRVIQKEEKIDQLSYEGNVSALLICEDIRPGDRLDFSFSISNYNKWNWPVTSAFHLQYFESWDKRFFRIIKEPDHVYQIQHYPSEWSSYFHEEPNEYIWDIEPCPSCHKDKDLPPGYCYCACYDISEAKSWNDLARLEVSLYQLDPSFGHNPEVIELIRSWQTRFSSVEEQALAALRFVQDEIRYFCLKDGRKGIIPSDPLTTLKRRFGDCKGKTQLLRSLLDQLGISSFACLVSTDFQKEIKNHLPALLFNHVITCIELDDQFFFVDPTQIFQGGPIHKIFQPYGYGLIISADTDDLTPIPNPVIHPGVDCSTNLTLTELNQIKMQFTVHFYGKMADKWRSLFNINGSKKALGAFQSDLETQFGSVQIENPVQINDDRSKNLIAVSTSIIVEDPWIPSKYNKKLFRFFPLVLSQYFRRDIDTERESPLYVPLSQIKESVTFEKGILLTDSTTIDTDAFTFTVDASENKVEYDLQAHLDTIDPSKLESYSENLDKAAQAMEFALLCHLDPEE